jgi:hypothetical protein
MSFRRKPRDRDAEKRWQEWMACHREDLRSCGLAPEVLLSLDHWEDFLENGWLHWHEEGSSHWRVQQLSRTQKAALLRLLESQGGELELQSNVLRWMRVACRGSDRSGDDVESISEE